jgi:hypothetical protein
MVRPRLGLGFAVIDTVWGRRWVGGVGNGWAVLSGARSCMMDRACRVELEFHDFSRRSDVPEYRMQLFLANPIERDVLSRAAR